jgi:mono/diheme cytochrome c family protein
MDERTKFIVSKNPVAHGAWLWTQYCYRCHLAYDESRQGRDADREDLQQIIEEGKIATQMEAFSRQFGGELKSREIDNIVHYIYTFEDLDAPPALPDGIMVPPTPDPAALIPVALPEVPPVEGDAQHGEQLYTLHCQRCHGAPDEGDIGPRLAKDWHSVRPDLTIKATMVQGVPGAAMPAWGQEQDGPLTEQDVNDLVAYVLTWSPERETPESPAWASDPSPRWQGRLGMVLLLAGPLILGAFALVGAPKRQQPKRRRRR